MTSEKGLPELWDDLLKNSPDKKHLCKIITSWLLRDIWELREAAACLLLTKHPNRKELKIVAEYTNGLAAKTAWQKIEKNLGKKELFYIVIKKYSIDENIERAFNGFKNQAWQELLKRKNIIKELLYITIRIDETVIYGKSLRKDAFAELLKRKISRSALQKIVEACSGANGWVPKSIANEAGCELIKHNPSNKGLYQIIKNIKPLEKKTVEILLSRKINKAIIYEIMGCLEENDSKNKAVKKLLKMRKLKSWDLSQALRYAKSSELRNEILKIILEGKTNINLNYDFLTHFEKNAREQKMLELIKEKITTGGKKDKEIQEIIKNMETVAASRRKINSA